MDYAERGMPLAMNNHVNQKAKSTSTRGGLTMLLQEPSAVGLSTRFHPARDRLATGSRRENGKDLRGDAERFLRDMAFALTLTHRVKKSIFAERQIGLER